MNNEAAAIAAKTPGQRTVAVPGGVLVATNRVAHGSAFRQVDSIASPGLHGRGKTINSAFADLADKLLRL